MGGEEDIRLPLAPGPVSNGEFMPAAASPAEIRPARAVIGRAARAADALGMDRRLFLQTAGGMAAARCGRARQRAAILTDCASITIRAQGRSAPDMRLRVTEMGQAGDC
jgi:hypothetical protein